MFAVFKQVPIRFSPVFESGLAMHHFHENARRRRHMGTVTVALPRSLNTSFSTSFSSCGVKARGRPPATESVPRHAGSSLHLLITLPTERRQGDDPSFFFTSLTISSRVVPAFIMPDISPRANVSIRAKDMAETNGLATACAAGGDWPNGPKLETFIGSSTF